MKDFIRNFILFLFVFTSLFFVPKKAYASHVAGGYIQLECTGTPGVYNVKLVLYRDCSGIGIGGNKTVTLVNDCGLGDVDVNVNLESSQEVSQTCASQAGNTECRGGSNPGYEEYVYTGTVNLGECDSWTGEYTLCCRNSTTNVDDADDTDFSITSEFNTATDNCNISPTVTAQPEPFVCNNQPVSYNLGAFEPDGDSIVYTLVPATDNGSSVSYNGGFSGTNPIPGVSIDPVTGTVTYTPTVTGNYIFVIQMTEYNDNGDIVTVTNYEYQTYVLNCGNQPPQPPSSTPGGGVTNVTGSIIQNGPNDLTLCQGNQGCFDVVFTDPDAGDVLTVQSNLASVLPGATITESGTNPLTITVCWQPTSTQGTVSLNFLAEDDACPIPGQNNYAASINVINPGIASVTTTTETCGGTDKGTATISVAGGSGGSYTFDIDNQNGPTTGSNSTGQFTDLEPGTYDYTVYAPGGCELQGTFTIVAGPDLPLTASGTDLLCNGSGDGTATANPTGGQAPYVYVWSQGGTPIGQTTQTASNLSANTYEVEVTDNEGCTNTATVVVGEPAVLNGSLNPTDAECNGEASGQIDVTGVSGGSSSYTYALNNGTPQAGTNFSNLSAGNYQVEILDGNNCSLILNTTIGEPTPLVISVDNIDDATCGSNSGSIDLSAAGGTTDYEYSIGGANQSSGSFTNLAPQTYTVTVTDGNGCTNSTTATVGTVVAPTAVVDNQENLDCFGGNNGEVIIGTSGALAPVLYTLDGGTGQASNSFTGLAAGPHTVDITDDNGCTASVNFTITEPSIVSYTATPTNALCKDSCNGEIAIVPSGGVSPYEYSSNNGLSFSTNSTLTGLCAGSINVVVKDDNGCLVNSTETITEPTQLTATFNNTDPTCKDGTDGEIEVNASGGTPLYYYSVNSGTLQTGNTLTGLPAGSHDIIVEDDNGCQFTATQTLDNPPGIDIDTLSVSPSNCGFNDGELVVEATGANSPFQYSINNGPNQSNGTFSNQLAGSYKVIVTDALGCTDSTFFGINDVQMDGELVDSSNISCFGGSDGMMEVINLAGAIPITYELDNSGSTQTSGTFNGLSAGPHIVTIYDGGFCVFTIPLTLTEPDEIDFDATITDVACNGGTTGQIEIINPSGGTGDFQYSIDGGFTFQTSTVFTDLSEGLYTIIALDENGCYISQDFQVNEATEVSFTANLFDLTCNGDNSGAIQIVASGGAGNYTYSDDNGLNFQASNSFSGLAADDYDLIVKDGSGCTDTVNVVITEPTLLTATYTTQNATCFGTCDGEIEIVGSGGTSPYNYSADNGTTLTTNTTITGLCEGGLTAYVEDDHGCIITSSETINEPTQVTFTSTEVPSTCSDANGEINIVAAGGTPDYSYSIDNGATFSTSDNAAGLSAGTYDLVVEDDNNCPATGTQIVTNEASPQIDLLTGTDPLCNGDANGEIEVTASGGTGTLSYTVDGGTAQSTNVLNGLTVGMHTVTVTDDNGCTDSEDIILSEPDVLSFTSDSTDLTCFENSTGSILVTPDGGTPFYQYSFDNGTTFGSSPSNNFIAAGTYDIVLRDANGCEVSGTQIVNEPPLLEFDAINPTDASCNSFCDGEIELNVIGGTTPYSYNWVQGVAGTGDNTATSLCAGSYDYIVTDDNGCIIDDVSIIDEPDSVDVTDVTKSNVVCNGDCDGTIEVTAPTGTQYSIDNGVTFQPSNVFNNLCEGGYDIVVQDAAGCLVEDTAYIWQADPLQLEITDDTTVCYGFNYQIIGVPQGGIQPYTYNWTNGTSTTDTLEITATQTETYSLDLVDYNGCTVPTENTTVTVLPQVDINVQMDTTICPGGTATLTAAGVGGLPSYDYSWNTGNTGGTINASPSNTTIYTATVTDQCGDQATDSAQVDIYDLPTISFEVDSANGCIPQTVNFTNTTDPSLLGNNCTWTVNGETYNTCSDLSYTFNAAFCYDVSLEIESSDGCQSDTTYQDFICIDDFPTANFNYNPDQPTTVNNNVNFTNLSVGADTYNWTFEGQGSTNETNPSVLFTNLEQATEITVCLEAISQYGCKDMVCTDIEFGDEFTVHVPNSFTPDEDPYNPVFKPVFPPGVTIKDYQLLIFNRWGELLFESYDQNIGWNGTYGIGSDKIVKDGTYVWKIKVTDDTQKEEREFVGHVNLLR